MHLLPEVRCCRRWRLKHLTRPAYAIRTAVGADVSTDLSESDVHVLVMIGYFQPVTRSELEKFFGREISRDQIGHLRRLDSIASGPYTFVTTLTFLLRFELNTLRDLPDFEAIEPARPVPTIARFACNFSQLRARSPYSNQSCSSAPLRSQLT